MVLPCSVFELPAHDPPLRAGHGDVDLLDLGPKGLEARAGEALRSAFEDVFGVALEEAVPPPDIARLAAAAKPEAV